ncbi:MAG: hypothetical protein QOF73_402 [Thermomicrobiales bacterium]|nr:hypothetical protein [Thermomicrobiales bacterium]
MGVRIGVGWCSSFDRPLAQRLHGYRPYRRLRYAYRAPSLFLQGMLRAGADVEFVEFDGDFGTDDLVSRPGRPIDVLYVASHGMSRPDGYRLALHETDWRLALPFGVDGPTVAVFDTCFLVNRDDRTWWQPWLAGLGPSLRLVLGFSSFATVGERQSERGAAFARDLTTMPFVAAWCAAVGHTSYPETDEPVAIAFGDDAADASHVMETASVGSLPPPRTGAIPVVAWWPR